MAAQSLSRLVALLGLLMASPAWAVEPPAEVAALAPLCINSEVHGDVIALAGDVVLEDGAWVHGDAIAVLGSVDMAATARVDGRVIALSSLASLSLEPGSAANLAHLDAALRLLSSGGWLLVTTFIAWLFPVRVRHGLHSAARMPARILLLGLMVALTVFAALVAVLGFTANVGIPLAAAIMMAFVVVKAVGLSVLGGALGRLTTRRWPRRGLPLTWLVFVGVAAFLLLRIVPVVGAVAWTLLSVAALGAGIFTLALNSAAVALPNES